MRNIFKTRSHKVRAEHFLMGSICIAVFLMIGIGYALLSTQLDITGTAQITSDWKILFTSAEEKEMNNATTNKKEITGLTTLTLDVQLQQPGASATYDVVVENQGDLDAMLTAINGVDEANSQSPLPIKVGLSNIRVGDALLSGEEKTFQVRVYWDASVDFNETEMQKEIEITLTYEQREESEIPSPSPAIDITDEVVSSGDGLYVDQYEPGRYIYRGSEPNNYIQFNNELWRIIAKETDGTYKIIRDEVLENRAFDEANYRPVTNNTYCTLSEANGCNVYGAVSGTYTLANQSGTVTEDSSLAKYLNGEYYNSLTFVAKSQMQVHSFNIGGVIVDMNRENDIADNLENEKAYQWTGHIGLPNMTDYLRASLNPSCTSASQGDTFINCTDNYFVDEMVGDTSYWTINGYYDEFLGAEFPLTGDVWPVIHFEGDTVQYTRAAKTADRGVRPTLFLSSSIRIISGNGTKANPYIIE